MIYKHIITNVLIALIVSLPITLAEELSLVYDANGNLVTGDGIYREYNSLNQLWKVYNGSDSNGVLLQEYMHEPGEERVLMKKTFNESGLVETVYYPFKELTRVVNSSGTYDFTNVYHEGQLVAVRHPDGTKEFYHPDHLGSTTLITDESGDVVEETEYSPFGVILSGGDGSRYDYEGKEFDKITGAFDFHFRKYCAKWGKFCTPDTLIQNVYDPQSLNRYAFERNNAYKYTDPTGHAATALIAIAAGIAIINIIVFFGGEIISSNEKQAYQEYAQGIRLAAEHRGGTAYGVFNEVYADRLETRGTFAAYKHHPSREDREYIEKVLNPLLAKLDDEETPQTATGALELLGQRYVNIGSTKQFQDIMTNFQVYESYIQEQADKASENSGRGTRRGRGGGSGKEYINPDTGEQLNPNKVTPGPCFDYC